MTATVSAFAWVPPFAEGFVRDHRVRWAHEEAGIPYETALLEGDMAKSPEYLAWQPFGQVPAYRDGEVKLFESGAIVLHIARKSEALAPKDEAGFAEVASWCFAALNSVEPQTANFANLETFHAGAPWLEGYKPVAEGNVRGRLARLEAWLVGREYLTGRFTAADILMATVLRELESSGLLGDYPNVDAYVKRCLGRPAWKRALAAQLADFRAREPA